MQKSELYETTKLRKLNKTGVKGVCFSSDKEPKIYKAYISKHNVFYMLGYFDTLEEAAYARKIAEEELHEYGTLVKKIRRTKCNGHNH